MIWNCKKSVMRHGKRDIAHGDVVPEDVLAKMGKDRVAQLIDKGTLKKGGKSVEPDERDLLMDSAKAMGLHPHHATGVDKLKSLIEDEGARIVLMNQAKSLQLDVSDDDTAEVLQGLIDEANG